MKLNLEDVLFVCLGMAGTAPSLVDTSDRETSLERLEAVDGVDFGIEKEASIEMERDFVDVVLIEPMPSCGGAGGGIGWSGRGFWCSGIMRRPWEASSGYFFPGAPCCNSASEPAGPDSRAPGRISCRSGY